MNTDFPQQAQRSAVCYRQWREGKAINGYYRDTDGTLFYVGEPLKWEQPAVRLLDGKRIEMNTTGTDDVQIGDNEPGKALSLERLQSRIYDALHTQFPTSLADQPVALTDYYVDEMFDEYVVISAGGVHWKITYADDGETVTFAPRDEWQKVKEERNWIDTKNALKAVSKTADTLTVANYIVLFDVRDLEGIEPLGTDIMWHNRDGSRGEYFTKSTELESSYTATGQIHLDYEHGAGKQMDGTDAPGRDDILGYVDWSTKRVDTRGVWVERAINRHNAYARWIETLIDAGIVGTSSEPVQADVQKADDGSITRWPLHRDTLTITPMEWRNKTENVIQAFKALGLLAPDDSEPEPEHETSPEADTSAVDVAKAKARAQQILLSLMEE